MITFLKSLYQQFSPARKIASTFLFVILTGAFLLWLPISNQNGDFFDFIDSLFIATSATCVTGLSTTAIATQFNVFGKLVVMVLIQIGGLGLMTLMALFVLAMKNRLSMKEKIAMREMLNKNNIFDMKSFLVDILKYTLVFEGIGFFILAIHLIPEFGFAKGGFHALFLAVSAFCNAGFDLFGSNSLIDYRGDFIMNTVIILLIILGGIGFAVWFDVRDKIRSVFRHHMSIHKAVRTLSTHTKAALIMTLILIFGGALIFFLLEYPNPETFQNYTLGDMVFASLFQSVTLRTAGFATMDLATTTIATKFLMMVFMFIGGSPGGTAGGIKTTTFFVLCIFIYTMLKGKEHIKVFHRLIPKEIVIRATNVMTVNMLTLFSGIFLLCISDPQLGFMNLAFEAVSAMATVGLTLGITSSLSVFGKCIIIVLMYIGRIGITTLLLSMIKMKRVDDRPIAYPSGNILIG